MKLSAGARAVLAQVEAGKAHDTQFPAGRTRHLHWLQEAGLIECTSPDDWKLTDKGRAAINEVIE